MKFYFYFTFFTIFVHTLSAINPKLLEIRPNKLSEVLKKFIIDVIEKNSHEKDGFLFVTVNKVESEFSDFISEKLNINSSVTIMNIYRNQSIAPLLNPNHFKIVLADPEGDVSYTDMVLEKVRISRAKFVLILTRVPLSIVVDFILNSCWKKKIINVIIAYEQHGKMKIATYNPYLPSSRKIQDLSEFKQNIFFDKTRNLYKSKVRCLLPYFDRTKIRMIQSGDGLYYEGKDYLAIQTLVSHLNGNVEIVTLKNILLNPWYESIIFDNRTERKKKILDQRNIDLLIKSERFTVDDQALDNLYPHTQNDLKSLVPKSYEISVSQSVLLTFTSEIWIIHVLCTLVVFTLWFIFKKMSGQFVDIQNMYFNIFRIIITNNVVPLPKKVIERVLIVLWIYLCLILNTVLQSKITSYLAIRKYYAEIDTIDELLASGLPLYSISIHIEEIQKKYAGTKYEPYAKNIMPLATNEGFLDQMTYKANVIELPVFFTESDLALFVSRCKCYRKNGVQLYHLMKESLIPNYQSYKVVHNSPLLPTLNRNLRRLSESGLIDLWAKTAIFNATIEGFLSPEDDNDVRSTKPLSLKDMTAWFYTIVLGYVLAMASFISEIIMFNRFKIN